MVDENRRVTGKGRRAEDAHAVTFSDLDEALAHRDARVRSIFREEIKAALGDGLGHAIRREVQAVMRQHEDEMKPHMKDHDWMVRVLRGDPGGLDDGAIAALREHRQMVDRIRTISTAIKIAVPLIGLDVIVRIIPPVVDLLGGLP